MFKNNEHVNNNKQIWILQKFCYFRQLIKIPQNKLITLQQNKLIKKF